MKRGPRPSSKCPRDIHFTPREEDRDILDAMGSGGTSAKLQALIQREGERQFPLNDKVLLLAKWIEIKKETMAMSALTNKMEERLILEGYTREELFKLFGGDRE